MNISAVLNVHSYPEVVYDTIESIHAYMTHDVLMVVDDASTQFEGPQPVPYIRGVRHNTPRSPFRNVALGLMSLVEQYPDSDWYCYIEYDCLVASARFRKNLLLADERNVWMMGNDGHVDEQSLPMIEALVGESLKNSYYLLGACQFFGKKFIAKLNSINFFERFLNLTNGFPEGVFPLYNGYDISEHMYPTLCRHFGGNIGVFATYDYQKAIWHGSHKVFPIRWKPEIDPKAENFAEASIIHPLKSFDHPIREHHRKIRHALRHTQGVRPGPGHFATQGG